MQQLQRIDQHRLQGPQCSVLADCIVGIVQSGLYHLDIPVTELIPDEVINLLYGDTQFKVLHVVGHIADQSIQLGQDPLIHRLQCIRSRGGNLLAVHVHHDKSGGIPHLVGEITGVLYSLIIESHIISRCISGDQCQSQCIRTVLIDDLQRIDAVAQ